MPVEITQNGTYGAKMPKMPPRPIMKIIFGAMSRFLRLRGTKVLTLITVGAKSGRTHEVDLACFPDSENRWLIIGAFGGSAKHPAWYYNLAHHPDRVWIILDGRKMKVCPDLLTGHEREAKFNAIVAAFHNYSDYQKRTDRQLPVIRLTIEPK